MTRRIPVSRHRLALVASLLAAVPLAGARAEEPEKTLSRAVESETPATNRVVYVCPRDALLTVEFTISVPGKPAVVQPPDGAPISLPLQLSGSGFRYADDTHELRGKGREVTWTDGSGKPVICTERTDTTGGPAR